MLHFERIYRLLKPKFFIIGIFVGFVLCCLGGYIVSKSARFSHFVRFYRQIQPESFFYPTFSELLATVKHRLDPSKILVLVGGSSVFRGVGQNPDEVWTLELQRILGSQFQVFNFAVDGGSSAAYAGVVYRFLSDEQLKILFLTDCGKHGDGDLDGVNPYKYVFWDAYYKGFLHFGDAEMEKVSSLRKKEIKDNSGLELHLMSYLDSFFYFKDFWNWVSYRALFSVWSDFALPRPLQGRLYFRESFLDLADLRVKNENARFDDEVNTIKHVVEGLADLSKGKYKKNVQERVNTAYNNIFDLRFRKKMLCVVTSDNPKHLKKLSKQYQLVHTEVENEAKDLLRELKYNAIIVGQDFSPEDFSDGRHLSKLGGNKMAVAVAKNVRKIAIENNYMDSNTLSI